MSEAIAVVRIRGSMETREEVEFTLKQLGLTRKNHCTLLKASPSVQGMLEKARDFIAWGEASEALVSKLVEKKGEFAGGKKFSQELLEKNSSYKTLAEFSKALASDPTELRKVREFKRVFRLSPPKKGFGKSIKLHYPKGALGYWGSAISGLIERML